MKQKPVAIGLLLCEQVIVEENTRNVTPVNCFTFRLKESSQPQPLSFVVLGFLTDGLGKIQLDVTIQRIDNMEEIHHRTQYLEFQNPLQSFRFTLRIKNCVFPDPGQYLVSLLADGEMIAQRKLHLIPR